jgi:hypothetical protein
MSAFGAVQTKAAGSPIVSAPNFHFHAVTAYNILRSRGVPLGKRDYEGRLRTSSF